MQKFLYGGTFFDLSIRTFVSKVLKLILFLSLSKVLKLICFSVFFILGGASPQNEKTEKQISLRTFDKKKNKLV